MLTEDAVGAVCELARKYAKPETVRRAKERQAAVLAGEEPDYLPAVFDVPVPELDRLPSYDWREQWYDPAKSFVEQMKGVVCAAASGSDAVLAVRADTGVVNAPTMFGSEISVPTHTKPVVTGYVPKDRIREFTLPDDIRGLGIVPRIVQHIDHHMAAIRANGLSEFVGVYHCDTQGPFDIACQVRGHDIFTDLYDDPPFVHHLMEQSLRAYIALSRLCKQLQGEGETWGNAAGIWMKRGGVRLCDDSGILLPVNLFEEFVLPYHRRAFEPFGGGWIHYCGGIPGGGRAEGLHLHDAYLSIPLLCGFNFTTGHDLGAEIRKLIARGIAYFGGWPRVAGDDLSANLAGLLRLCPGRRGLILQMSVSDSERAQAMGVWHRAQDTAFGKAR